MASFEHSGMSMDLHKHVVMESGSLKMGDAIKNEQNIKKCRFTVLLTGTTEDFMRGSPVIQISPKIFGKDAMKRLIVKQMKLEYAKNSAPFTVNLTISQNGESSACMNSLSKEGSNSENSSFLTIPFNTTMDCMREPVVMISFDKLTREDYEMVLQYESCHDMCNVSSNGVMLTDITIRDEKTQEQQKVYYVKRNHPMIAELSKHSEEIRQTFSCQRDKGLVDGKYRVGESAVNFGLKLVEQRLKRCPVLDVNCLKFHASCGFAEIYRPIIEMSENPSGSVHQVYAAFSLDYIAF
jgi:hypothetical protein